MINFAFFGTSEISVIVLDELKKVGLIPSLIITQPDKPKGRSLELAPSPVKIWAQQNNIEFVQPIKIKGVQKDESFYSLLQQKKFDVFVLVSYGKIIPQEIIDLAPKGIINVHPSLLPMFRGPSPLEATILSDNPKHVGVTIMRIDAEMDHGPILKQESVDLSSHTAETDWPIGKIELEQILGKKGGQMLAEVLPQWVSNVLQPVEQDHLKATYCTIIEKQNGFIEDINDPQKAREYFLKLKAFEHWPGIFTFIEHPKTQQKIRLIIKDATFENNLFTPTRVIPQGKKEMLYQDFLRGLHA